MATQNLLQPVYFLQEPGEPAILWRQWISSFKTYLTAIDGDNFSAARRKALLLHCLGIEGQRIFNTLPGHDSDTVPDGSDVYKEAVKLLENRFSKAVNVVAERYKFKQRAQASGESIDSFISALRDLAKTCDFDTKTDEMIRDQIIEKTNCSRIRDKLLTEKDLTLDKAIEFSRRVESAITDSRTFTKSPNSFTSVHKVSSQKQASYKTKQPGNSTSNVTNKSNVAKGSCFRCGSNSHWANSPFCAARHKRCNVCSKVGHFSNVCHFARRQTSSGTQSAHVSKPVHQVKIAEPDEDGFDHDLQVLAIDNVSSHAKPVYCDVLINNVNVVLMVDTGSAVSILTKDTFSHRFPGQLLNKPLPGHRLSSFTEHEIPIIGSFDATVCYKGNNVLANIFVVRHGCNILGRDLVNALH